MMVPFLSPEITPNFSIGTKQSNLEIQILCVFTLRFFGELIKLGFCNCSCGFAFECFGNVQVRMSVALVFWFFLGLNWVRLP